MRILVTGGAGFIGSNFVRYMLVKYPDVEIVNFDLLTYAGNLDNLTGIEDDPRYSFVRGNIGSVEDVEGVFKSIRIDAVVNFAAESHVDRSLHIGATAFVETNVLGVQVLLDAGRKYGVKRFVQVSTDEVYGSIEDGGRFSEDSLIQPNNPYAATKAGADFLVRAAHKSYGFDTVTTRCSNNFGPYQFPEKLIPLMITNALEDKSLPVYGDGMHVRDWIYVLDHCSAVDIVLRKGVSGDVYNIGGNHDVSNIEIIKLILGILGKPESLIEHVKDRPGHDRRYAIESGKIEKELGWRCEHSFDQALRSTVTWYLENPQWWRRVKSGEYTDSYARIYGTRR